MKLTLRLDEKLIRSAEIHAGALGKSLSQMVADYFYLLDRKRSDEPFEPTPTVKSLKGSLRGADVDEGDCKSYLENKYL